MVNRRIIDQTEAISLSSDDYLVADNVNLGTRKIQFTRLLSGATPLPPNYSTGYNFSVITDETFSVSSGYSRSTDNTRNIILNSSLIKDIASTFDLGNNAGCMPSGLTLQASTKYYIFAISTSGGQTDVIIDTNENCENGLADNTVVLNNFDKFSNLGFFYTDTNSKIFTVSYFNDYIIEKRNITETDGYNKFRSGLIEQYGKIQTNGSAPVVFPLPMKNTGYNILTTPLNNGAYAVLSSSVDNITISTTGMTVQASHRTGGSQGGANVLVCWKITGLAQGGF